MPFAKINPHVLADWGITTGRLPLTGRADFVESYGRDPALATGSLLLTPATRDVTRICPLFGSPDPYRSAAARRVCAERKTRSEAVSEALAEAVNAAKAAKRASRSPALSSRRRASASRGK